MTCPTGKVAYPSPQAAQRVLACMCKRAQGKHRHYTGGPLRPFQCACGQWHLGHGVPHANHAARRVDAKSRSCG